MKQSKSVAILSNMYIIISMVIAVLSGLVPQLFDWSYFTKAVLLFVLPATNFMAAFNRIQILSTKTFCVEFKALHCEGELVQHIQFNLIN
jgi:hypothetical protein